MGSKREVHVGEANLACLHVLLEKSVVRLVVPLLAVRALEVADFNHPQRGAGAALNPGEVGARNDGVGLRRPRSD